MVTIMVLKEDISLVHLTSAVIHNGQAYYQLVEKPPGQRGALYPKRVFLTKIYVIVSMKKTSLSQTYKNSISPAPITGNEDLGSMLSHLRFSKCFVRILCECFLRNSDSCFLNVFFEQKLFLISIQY